MQNTTSQISPSVTKCGFPQVDKIECTIVLFPSMATRKEDYEKNRKQIMPFSELPTSVILHMYNVQSLTLKDGRTSYYAEFMTKSNRYYKAWIPKTVFKKFQRLEVERCCVVKNKGKRYISNNIDRTYLATMVGILE